MQNKPNLRNDKMNISLDMKSIYKILSSGSGQKTKPIQSQFKPNKAKNKPNLSQNKPKTNPIQTQFQKSINAPKQWQENKNLMVTPHPYEYDVPDRVNRYFLNTYNRGRSLICTL